MYISKTYLNIGDDNGKQPDDKGTAFRRIIISFETLSSSLRAI